MADGSGNRVVSGSSRPGTDSAATARGGGPGGHRRPGKRPPFTPPCLPASSSTVAGSGCRGVGPSLQRRPLVLFGPSPTAGASRLDQNGQLQVGEGWPTAAGTEWCQVGGHSSGRFSWRSPAAGKTTTIYSALPPCYELHGGGTRTPWRRPSGGRPLMLFGPSPMAGAASRRGSGIPGRREAPRRRVGS